MQSPVRTIVLDYIEVDSKGTQSPAMADEPTKVCRICIRISNGPVLSRRKESKRRSACLVHIKRLFVNALEESYYEPMGSSKGWG